MKDAAEVPDNGEPVFVGDSFYSSLENYREGFGEDEIARGECAEFAYCSTRSEWQLDLDRVLQDEQENFCDGAGDYNPFENLLGLDELRAAVDAFNKLNKGRVVLYDEDLTRKIRVRSASS